MALINGIVRSIAFGTTTTALALFTACNGGDPECVEGEELVDGECLEECDSDESRNDDGECEADEDTGDTGTTGWTPTYVGVSGYWGYSSDTDTLTAAKIDNAGTIQEIPNTIIITFVTEDYLQTGNEAFSCPVALQPTDALGFASWAQNANAYFGFAAPAGTAGGYLSSGNCAEMDLALFGGQEPYVWASAFDWGLSAGAIDADLYASLESQLSGNANFNWDKNWKDKLMGGSWYSTGMPDNENTPGSVASDVNFVRASAVDGDFVMQFDDEDDQLYIDASVIASAPQSGIYESNAGFFLPMAVFP